MNRNREEDRQFVSNAVHDLRESLRAVRTSSELLAAKCGDPARAAQPLSLVQDGVARLESLIHDIAEFAYAEIRELDRLTTDLETVLNEAQRELEEELRSVSAILTHDPLPAVTGDFLALAEVVRNLLHNACKFRGEAAPRIHLGSVRQGSDWLFSVKDNGIGFDPVYVDQVFKPFGRLNGRKYTGSGLGLSVARKIVERHGGRIWADSSPGQGSTLWFTLPAQD
jgi:signal transduction histidine kinase